MSQSYAQKPLYIRALVAVINLALWLVKAWGMANSEWDETCSLPTNGLCTTHVIAGALVGLVAFVIGIPLTLVGFVPAWAVVCSASVLYLGIGMSLRYFVGKRCGKLFPGYDYVGNNLNLLH